MLKYKTEDLDVMIFILNYGLVVIFSHKCRFAYEQHWMHLIKFRTGLSCYQEEQRMGFPMNKLKAWSVEIVFPLNFVLLVLWTA
jgi:hypothetical protein